MSDEALRLAQTPRTDKLVPHLNLSHQDMHSAARKLRELSRTLERELNALRAECEKLKEENERLRNRVLALR